MFTFNFIKEENVVCSFELEICDDCDGGINKNINCVYYNTAKNPAEYYPIWLYKPDCFVKIGVDDDGNLYTEYTSCPE
ncbi:MAG: hypothetical protein PHG22_01345 [Patescibacteria group bacterium]|nr:hypothetical protein [Patescibacteria group bacterium]